MLRTNIIDDGGSARQVTAQPRSVPLKLVDLRETAATSRINRMQSVLRDQASISFDLAHDLLLRASLVTMAADEYALLLVSHPIASDEASVSILIRDLDALYRGAADAQAPLPIQYGDFAHWQRAQHTDARASEVVEYWRTRLAGATPRLELPSDLPPPPAPTFEGARASLRLSREVADAVQKTARVHATTSVVVLLAALEALLHRYAHRDDIVVGTVAPGRPHSELDDLVGPFANTLPLRVSLEGDLTFTELLFRVRDASAEAGQHADVPYETLAHALGADERGGLFNVMFAMLDDRAALGTLGGATLTGIALDRGMATFDLTIAPTFADEGLRIGMEYRSDLFDAATIERMLSHYGVLLTEAVSAPQTKIARLPLLAAAEQELVLQAWNATEVAYPPAETLVSLLEAQAVRTPRAIAVALAGHLESSGPRTLSFAELDARSTTLARALVARGVKPGILVGVCMDRGLELAAALVAVLKAGGAFVPLDPECPPERLAFMIDDARVPVVLTQRHVAEGALASLPRDRTTRAVDVLAVDRDWALIVSSAATLFDEMPELGPDDLAYVIYAPESPDSPTGAMNRHRGIVNQLLWMQTEYQLDGEDAVLHTARSGDSASLLEVLLPLTTGARLVMAEPRAPRDASYLAGVISAEGVSVTYMAPSVLEAFLDEPAASRCTSLREVMCSGESLPYDLQQRFFSMFGVDAGDGQRVRLHSLYGSMECAGYVSHWTCDPDDARRAAPIGRPISNTRLYVLDAEMQPVPVGVAGELYVGGAQVGDGYWDRTDPTIERFLPDLFAADGVHDARLFRTGDVARWLADGVVERLARGEFLS